MEGNARSPAVIGSTCPSCGVSRPSGARFCAQCGTAVAPIGDPAPRRVASRAGVLAGLGVATTLIGTIVGVSIVVGRPGSAAPAVGPSASTRPLPSPVAVATAPAWVEPEVPTANPTLTGRQTARLGDPVAITGSDGEHLGWVRVTRAVTYTSLRGLDVPDGFLWVGARVDYRAEAPFGFAELDWVGLDATGTRYEPTAFSWDPALGLGTLDAGQSSSGWISFEVPRGVEHLWAAFVNLDGGIVFGVRLY